MREKYERLKEWLWALIAAVAINGYIKMDLTIMQRILAEDPFHLAPVGHKPQPDLLRGGKD